MAKLIDNYPLSLKDVSNWTLLNLIAPAMKNVMVNGIIFVGPTGRGKTPQHTSLP